MISIQVFSQVVRLFLLIEIIKKKPSRQNFTTSNLTQAINFIEMTQLSKLEIKIFADGADIQEMVKFQKTL